MCVHERACVFFLFKATECVWGLVTCAWRDVSSSWSDSSLLWIWTPSVDYRRTELHAQTAKRQREKHGVQHGFPSSMLAVIKLTLFVSKNLFSGPSALYRDILEMRQKKACKREERMTCSKGTRQVLNLGHWGYTYHWQRENVPLQKTLTNSTWDISLRLHNSTQQGHNFKKWWGHKGLYEKTL